MTASTDVAEPGSDPGAPRYSVRDRRAVDFEGPVDSDTAVRSRRTWADRG